MVIKSSPVKTAEQIAEEGKEPTVTLSVRLSERERELLQKAAGLRGWSPTALLRTAALERAAHIVNTSTQTRIDFRGQAHAVAGRLAREHRAWGLSSDINGFPRKEPMPVVDDVLDEPSMYVEGAVEIEPRPMTAAELGVLQQAVKFGGAEFLNMIVEACHSASAPGRTDLPEPIDPGAPVKE